MKKIIALILAGMLLALPACNGDEDGSQASDTEASGNELPDFGGEFPTGDNGNGELPEYAAVGEDTAAAALKAVSDDIDTKKKQLGEGLMLNTFAFGESKAYILEIDLTKYGLISATPYGLKPDGTLQSIEGQAGVVGASGTEVIAGIAANAINTANVPCGMIISEGKGLYYSGGNDGSVHFGIYSDGKAFACDYGDYEKIYRNKVVELVSADRLIVINGNAVDIGGTDYEKKTYRTGAGFTADRNTVCLIYAEGVSLADLSNLLIGQGCSMGVNFNSGEGLGMLCDNEFFGTKTATGPTLLVVKK